LRGVVGCGVNWGKGVGYEVNIVGGRRDFFVFVIDVNIIDARYLSMTVRLAV